MHFDQTQAIINDLRSTSFDDVIRLRKAVRHVMADLKDGVKSLDSMDSTADPLLTAYGMGLAFMFALRRAAMAAKDPTKISPLYWAALTACLDLKAKIVEKEQGEL